MLPIYPSSKKHKLAAACMGVTLGVLLDRLADKQQVGQGGIPMFKQEFKAKSSLGMEEQPTAHAENKSCLVCQIIKVIPWGKGGSSRWWRAPMDVGASFANVAGQRKKG